MVAIGPVNDNRAMASGSSRMIALALPNPSLDCPLFLFIYLFYFLHVGCRAYVQ